MSIAPLDYYKILGLDKTAGEADIKRAYRKLARKYHPDVNKAGDAEDKFKEVSEAYEVLKDPVKRKKYDTFGQQWQEASAQGGYDRSGEGMRQQPRGQGRARTFTFSTDGDFGGAEEYSDFFRAFFENGAAPEGAGDRTAWAQPGRSQEAEITITLADAFHGATKTISLQSLESDGAGGVRPSSRSYQIKIPKGIQDGAVIRLSGQGEKGVGGGQAGDLLLRVRIEPDHRFHLDGHDIHTIVSVTPWEAALGAKIPVETLDGAVTLTVPRGSQNGKRLRLRGKGMPDKQGASGDLFVELEIRVPTTLTEEEEKLLADLARVSRFNPRAHGRQRGAKS